MKASSKNLEKVLAVLGAASAPVTSGDVAKLCGNMDSRTAGRLLSFLKNDGLVTCYRDTQRAWNVWSLSHQPTYPNGECKEMGGDPLSSVGTCSRKAAPVVRCSYLDGLANPSPAARRGAEGAPLSYLEQSEK